MRLYFLHPWAFRFDRTSGRTQDPGSPYRLVEAGRFYGQELPEPGHELLKRPDYRNGLELSLSGAASFASAGSAAADGTDHPGQRTAGVINSNPF